MAAEDKHGPMRLPHAGLTHAAVCISQVADFVGRYLPAYAAYLPALYAAAAGDGIETNRIE